MTRQPSKNGFTLVELLVVISIIALLIAILLPALGSARLSARKLQSNTQVRGQHQGMVTHAQSNKGFYPGITSKGDAWTLGADNISGKSGSNVQARFAILIEGDFVTADYVLHPNDPEPHTAYDFSGTDPFDVENYGYALLELANNTNPGVNAAMNLNRSIKSRAEWGETMNSEAIVISDRLIAVGTFGDPTTYTGVWSDKPGESDWGVVWNDNHTTAENVALFETNYAGIRNTSDDLFSRSKVSSGNVQTPTSPNGSPGNAMMISRDGARLLQN